MNKQNVLDLLEANRNDRGTSNWQALGTLTGGLRGLGIGLTQLRKLAKTPFVIEVSDDWTRSEDTTRRECGYGLLYEISKFKGKKAPDEIYFLDHVERIDQKIDDEPTGVRMAMGSALMGIGKRSAKLNVASLAVAERVGPIEFESASGNCDPFDVAKHLRTDRLKEKLSL